MTLEVLIRVCWFAINAGRKRSVVVDFHQAVGKGNRLLVHCSCVNLMLTSWVIRGIKEAVWERVKGPSLNKKGGLRFVLSHTWDRALRDVPSQLSRDTCVTQADSADS